MSDSSEVRVLFNAKARTWNQKYQPGGALESRATAFSERLAGLLSPKDQILDLGCGTGAIAATLAARGFRMVACDVAEQMIEACKRIHSESPIEWFLLPSDWKRLPFESKTFDGIVAASVFEYLPDVNAVLAECRRTLKSGGYLIATVPNPRALIRRLERLLRPAAMLANQTPMINRISRLQSYANYLLCSRNQMSLEEWFALGQRAGFTSVAADRSRASKTALAFLVFRKTDNKSELRLKNHPA
jgi:2-polyprenyl-3-methyl-5-hydroxy-6-metoxy-1,4-benzoquinol methylase